MLVYSVYVYISYCVHLLMIFCDQFQFVNTSSLACLVVWRKSIYAATFLSWRCTVSACQPKLFLILVNVLLIWRLILHDISIDILASKHIV